MGQWEPAIKDGQEGLKVAEEYSNNSIYILQALSLVQLTTSRE
jgi:hypothetical protein